MKGGSTRSEGVLRHERGITDSDRQPGFWVGCPDTTVLDAERATARARRDVRRVSFPVEVERDIAAVAFAMNEHTDIYSIGAPNVSRSAAGEAGRLQRWVRPMLGQTLAQR